MSEHLHRRSSHHNQGKVRGFIRANAFELGAVAAAALGIFLLFERWSIRRTLLNGVAALARLVFAGVRNIDDRLAAAVAQLSASDAIGVALLLGALAAGVLRLRWRLLRSPAYTTLRCPRCGGDIHRVHRKFMDRVVSVIVPVRRYHCSDRQCRWKGLRISAGHHARAARPSPAPR